MPRPDAAPGPGIAHPAVDHRTRPRRRGRTLDAAILEATITEIDQVGYHALSVERVAERARASKASLYRRWPNKVQLVMDAVYNLLPDPASATDTGSLRGDLLALFRSAASMLAGPGGNAIRGLISDALRSPQLAAQLRAYTRGRSAAAMRDVVHQAIRRGELPSGRLTDQQIEAGLSLMRFHFLTHDGPVSDSVIIEIVDEVVIPLFRAASKHDSRVRG